jgi:2-polyprenyl-3-methyl-5-hydroxy-6-metoxy-1,4-benzoquinol methylase
MQKFLAWKEAQGSQELPVQLLTYLKPEQQARVAWLRAQVFGRVLEVGCSWGFVLLSVTAANPNTALWTGQHHVGVDLTEWNVLLASILASQDSYFFLQMDARNLNLTRGTYNTVILAEVLEHLDWPQDVRRAVDEAIRVLRPGGRLLITIPDGRQDSDEACSFKHHYLFEKAHAQELLSWMPGASLEYRSGFALIRYDYTPQEHA